jgi:hypothetical protein
MEAAASSENGPVISRTLHSAGDEDFFYFFSVFHGLGKAKRHIRPLILL